jgi:plasmid stabilization system protein ParE
MIVKYRVEITQSAEADIHEIWEYISADSPETAAQFIAELIEQAEKLTIMPNRCPLIPENAQLCTQYRHLLYGSYRTIFRIGGSTVFVLRVIHGSRLLELG